MIVLQTSSGHRLRPVHLLLMLYRYLSGAYQLGDLSALNYVKGFLDGGGARSRISRVLSISGHGIGEPELWFCDRFPHTSIDALSFRLLDTQLIHFLRGAGPSGVVEVFGEFRQATKSLSALEELLGDPGLLPYWELQAAEWSDLRRDSIKVFSTPPTTLPCSRKYDVVYVSNSTPYLDQSNLRALRQHVSCGGWMAVSNLAAGPSGQFSDSSYAREARELFNQSLEQRGYPAVRELRYAFDDDGLAARRETIPFAVPASARTLLVGELLLYSMDEHISDRVRLQILSDVLSRVPMPDLSIKQTIELLLIKGTDEIAD